MNKSKTKESVKSELPYVLRVNLNNNWDANEIVILFTSLNKLYKFYFVLDFMNEEFLEFKKSKVKYYSESHAPFKFLVESGTLLSCFAEDKINDKTVIRQSLGLAHPLKVKSIKMNSPGFTDLVGFSGILGHLKDIMFNYFPNKKEKVEIEILEQQRQELLIKNLKEMGLNSIDIKQIILNEEINRTNIKRLVQNEKITSIELKSELKS